MNSHIKEHPIRLLAVLVGAILILSVAISLFSPSAPDEQLLPEESAAGDDSNLLRRPEVSLPDISIETTWSRHPDESEPEEPTIGALETSSQPEETSDETASEPEESSEPETSVETPSQPEEPSVPPTVEPEPEPEPAPEPQPEPLDKYTLNVRVTSTAGKALAGAEVTIGGVTGKTDSNGRFSATVKKPDTDLLIVANGYASYYEELTLTLSVTDTTVQLAPAGTTRSLLNSVELRPYRTDHEELNQALDKLLGQIIKPGMDTYDKVKACYDWVIAHMYYKRPTHRQQGYWECAYQALQDGYGTCNCYSLLFTAMVRHIGLNCYFVEGSTSANGGGMTGHYWTVIEIGGEFYIFDPQVEDAVADRTASKEVTYSRFCLKQPHAKYIYNVRSFSACIQNFESYLKEHGRFVAQ